MSSVDGPSTDDCITLVVNLRTSGTAGMPSPGNERGSPPRFRES